MKKGLLIAAVVLIVAGLGLVFEPGEAEKMTWEVVKVWQKGSQKPHCPLNVAEAKFKSEGGEIKFGCCRDERSVPGKGERYVKQGGHFVPLDNPGLQEFNIVEHATDTPVPTDTPTLAPTETLIPTDTPVPTDWPTPTATSSPTLAPTETPILTDTPVPTDWPTPTATSTPTSPPPALELAPGANGAEEMARTKAVSQLRLGVLLIVGGLVCIAAYLKRR